MACPYFVPLEPWSSDSWTGPRRVPLGQPYHGSCSLMPGAEIEVDVQARLCNFGYARGRCPHPPADAIDAVRFSIVKPDELIWISERDHAPVAFGTGHVPAEYGALARAFERSYRSGRAPQGIKK